MPAAKYDLLIEQGATFVQEFVWKNSDGTPVDITGASARMKIRKYKTDEVLVSLTSPSNGITLGGADGKITITISATNTSLLPVCEARYDLEIEDTYSFVTRFIEGNVDISAEVTR
jgi:hypothetical protein